MFDKHIFRTDIKILRFPDRIHDWLRKITPKPISSQIDITNKCDNKCGFCMYQHDMTEMKVIDAKSYLLQLLNMRCLAVNFSGGGEPTLHPDCSELIKFASDIGLRVGLITNGQNITDDLAKIIISKCDWVRVSLSATSRETFLKLRAIDNFEKAVNGIVKLASAKNNCTVGVQWIYTKQDSLSDLHHFIEEILVPLKVDYLQILPKQTFNSAELIAQRDLREIIDDLEILHPQIKILESKVDDLFELNFGRNYSQCHGCWFYVYITTAGDVNICCNKDIKIGSLKTDSLEQIWYSRDRNQINSSVDVSTCLPLCKHHNVNKVLELIKQKPDPFV